MFFTSEKQPQELIHPARQLEPIELMTDEEVKRYVGDTLAIDIEIYPNYFLIAFKHTANRRCIILEASSEHDFNPYYLSWILHNYCTIGFNSIKFDLVIAWLAYKNRHIPTLFEVGQKLIVEDARTYQLERDYNFKVYEINHIDLIEVAPLNGSLKTYAARLHAKRLQDLPFDPTKPLTKSQSLEVKDYCVNSDLDATILLWENLHEQIKLREDLSHQYNQNLMSKSDAQIAEAVIGSELRKISKRALKKPELPLNWSHRYIVPDWLEFKTSLLQNVLEVIKNAEYTLDKNGSPQVPESISKLHCRIGNSTYRMGNGGLHSSEQSVGYRATDDVLLLDRDVASYYPAIVLNNSFYPRHLGVDFLNVYRGLVESRLKAKAAKQTAIADALKITINGAFGKLGSPYSILYSPDLLIQVTMTGQLALLMLIESLELVGISVVSANTDGIVSRCPQDRKPAFLTAVADWEVKTGFMTEETTYSAVYSRDVNAYLAIKPDGTTKGKNAYFDPWSGGAKTAIFRFHKNPQTTICIEAAIAYMVNGTSISDTINRCRDITKFITVRKVDGGAAWKGIYLGKVVRWYYARGEFDTIKYARNGNKVPDSDGCKPCMDLPTELPTNINYDWYVEKTISILRELTFIDAPSKKVTFFD